MHLRRANQRGEDTTQTQRETHKRTNTHRDTLYVTERLGIDTREGKDLKILHLRRACDRDQWTEREGKEGRMEREKQRERERERKREKEEEEVQQRLQLISLLLLFE